MSFLRHTSRGRTRQPKNLKLNYHPDGLAHFRDSGSIKVTSNAAILDNDLTSSFERRVGYDTENQQYLHLCLATTGGRGAQFDVYVHNRQFGRWAKLLTPIPQGASTNTLETTYVATSISASKGTTGGDPAVAEYIIIPIFGADRVALVGEANNTITYVAGSSF